MEAKQGTGNKEEADVNELEIELDSEKTAAPQTRKEQKAQHKKEEEDTGLIDGATQNTKRTHGGATDGKTSSGNPKETADATHGCQRFHEDQLGGNQSGVPDDDVFEEDEPATKTGKRKNA